MLTGDVGIAGVKAHPVCFQVVKYKIQCSFDRFGYIMEFLSGWYRCVHVYQLFQ